MHGSSSQALLLSAPRRQNLVSSKCDGAAGWEARVDRRQAMRAYATDAFGETGRMRELPVPEPGPSEVRIRVEAAGTNPVDNAILQGFMKDMLEHRFPLVPGIDASGTIDAVGGDVTTLSVGDSVFGVTGKGYFGGGTYAEYTTMASASISQKPDGVGHESVAAIPTAGVTALMLLEALEPQAGQLILAIGATGGVGSYFVQLATERGARVIGVSRATNGDYVRSLGAENVIDYSAEDLGEAIGRRYPQGIDAIADMVGHKDELTSAIARLRAGGHVASCVGAVDEADLARGGFVGQNVSGVVTSERIGHLAALRSQGRLRDPDLESMPLERATEALERLASRHVRGKLVLTPRG
jgi:NADPH:quinone reductase